MGLRNRSHGAIHFDRYGGSSHVDRGVGHPSFFWSQRWRLSVQVRRFSDSNCVRNSAQNQSIRVLKRIRETVWDSETEGTARCFPVPCQIIVNVVCEDECYRTRGTYTNCVIRACLIIPTFRTLSPRRRYPNPCRISRWRLNGWERNPNLFRLLCQLLAQLQTLPPSLSPGPLGRLGSS